MTCVVSINDKEGQTSTYLFKAAELNMQEGMDPSNPFRINKDILLRQYRLWNGEELKLPPINQSYDPEYLEDDEDLESPGMFNHHGKRDFKFYHNSLC